MDHQPKVSGICYILYVDSMFFHFRSAAIKDVVEHCPGLEKPELMTATNYRHYVATAIQREELTDAERKSFYNHMGHSERVNQGIYQSPPAFTAVTRIGKFLQTLDKGVEHASSNTEEDVAGPSRLVQVADKEDAAIEHDGLMEHDGPMEQDGQWNERVQWNKTARLSKNVQLKFQQRRK